MTKTTRVLTGITTTGIPHIGNYVGAIRPAITASQSPEVESYFFLADFHALIKCQQPQRIASSVRALAATWLACGLDPARTFFYRQSDIPEIPELTWLLTCICSKGLMNRAHAYKAAVDHNIAAGNEIDDAVSMGLFNYPILMAADILMFNVDQVPVGKDQIQHIEMARDLAQRFNLLYGGGQDVFRLPEAVIDDSVAVLPGMDGRKMSKSYGNTIPLFEGGRVALQTAIKQIVTDSRAVGEAKEDAGDSNLMTIYRAFASAQQAEELTRALAAGMGWGEAKDHVFEVIDAQIAPMRVRYQALMSDMTYIDQILAQGAARARVHSRALLEDLRQRVGLGRISQPAPSDHLVNELDNAVGERQIKAKPLLFKQYREAGEFYFKLERDGQCLLQSCGFENGREAGRWVKQIKAEGVIGLPETVAHWSADIDVTDIHQTIIMQYADD